MKAFTKACALLIAAGGLAISTTSASAVEPRAATNAPAAMTVTGQTSTPIQLVDKAPKPEKIVVAGRRGRGIGLGILAGVGAAILLSKAARAHRRDRRHRGYHRSRARHFNRCERWDYRCNELGIRRACRKLYRRCY